MRPAEYVDIGSIGLEELDHLAAFGSEDRELGVDMRLEDLALWVCPKHRSSLVLFAALPTLTAALSDRQCGAECTRVHPAAP